MPFGRQSGIQSAWLILVPSLRWSERHPWPRHRIRRVFRRSDPAMLRILKQFSEFTREQKKWWLIPLIIVLLSIGALLLFSQGSALAPFLYPQF